MKSNIIVLATLFCLNFGYQSRIWADAGNGGTNGGGSVVINGQRFTLAQAGYTVAKDASSPSELQVKLRPAIQRAKEIISSFPVKESIKQSFIGRISDRGQYVSGVVKSKSKHKKLVDEYKKLLVQLNPNFDLSSFAFTALSDSIASYLAKTYVYPEFFELNLDGQATKLIHESLVIGKNLNSELYRKIFIFDNLLVQYIDDKLSKAYDFSPLLNSMADIFGGDRIHSTVEQSLLESLFIHLIEKRGAPIRLSEICSPFDFHGAECTKAKYEKAFPSENTKLSELGYPFNSFALQYLGLIYQVKEVTWQSGDNEAMKMSRYALKKMIPRAEKDCVHAAKDEFLFYHFKEVVEERVIERVYAFKCHTKNFDRSGIYSLKAN